MGTISLSVLMTQRSRSASVCVPYVKGMLRDETHREVLRQRRRAVFVELPASSPTAYAKLLIERITPERTAIIVEHDVIPPPHALDNLARCQHAWCTHPMRHGGVRKDDLLGLAAFKPWLFTLRPRWVECALLGGLGSYRWPHWRSLDTLVARYLRHHGVHPHVHRPDAVHLHYPDPEWTPWCGWPMFTPDEVNPHA